MMDDGQSILTRRKVNNDLLSDLPLSIIHCILALVPIRDAIKTSILSKQWRYKWASLPCLVFDEDCVDHVGKSDNIVRECLKNFIANTLLVHEGPIHKFELSIPCWEIFPVMDHCLLWLSRNEIRELFIDMEYYKDDDDRSRVHSSIYSCQKLTHLKLYGCKLCPPPLTFKGFACLRGVVLRDVVVSLDAVESLVANSPLLDSFTYNCIIESTISEFRISAPNLKYFNLSGVFEEISLNAPLVAEVSVSLVWTKALSQKSSVCNYTKFLGGFTSLESLGGRMSFTKYLSIGIEAYDHSLVFHHLKIISLYQVGFRDIREALVVVHLIMGAPNLEALELSTSAFTPKDAFEAPPKSFSDFRCTSNKLRVIEMRDVCGLPYELEFIKFCLRSSPVLETMALRCSYEFPTVGIMDFMTELLSYSRASTNAKILFKRR